MAKKTEIKVSTFGHKEGTREFALDELIIKGVGEDELKKYVLKTGSDRWATQIVRTHLNKLEKLGHIKKQMQFVLNGK